MIRIIDHRCTGKTNRLLLLAKENNAIIVCHDPRIYREKMYRYGLTGIDFITYSDFKDGQYDKMRPVYIDELELFAKYIAGGNLAGYTLSME